MVYAGEATFHIFAIVRTWSFPTGAIGSVTYTMVDRLKHILGTVIIRSLAGLGLLEAAHQMGMVQVTFTDAVTAKVAAFSTVSAAMIKRYYCGTRSCPGRRGILAAAADWADKTRQPPDADNL